MENGYKTSDKEKGLVLENYKSSVLVNFRERIAENNNL